MNQLAQIVVPPDGAVCGSSSTAGVGSLAEVVHGVGDGGNVQVTGCLGVGLCQEEITAGVPGVGDGVDGAGDGPDETVGTGLVAVGEGCGAVADGREAAGGGMIGVGGLVLDRGIPVGRCAGDKLELPAGVPSQGPVVAVQNPCEVKVAVVVAVVGNGFGVDAEVGGIGVFEFRLFVLGDAFGPAERVEGIGECRGGLVGCGGVGGICGVHSGLRGGDFPWGRIRIVFGRLPSCALGEIGAPEGRGAEVVDCGQASAHVTIGGDPASRPGAGLEASGKGVGV